MTPSPAPAASPLERWTAATAADRSDAELLAGLRAHQGAALQELYERYLPTAYALAVRMLDDPALAEECVQVVFLHLWQHPPLADLAPTGVSAWLLPAIHQQARTQQPVPPAPRPPRTEVPASLAAAAAAPTAPGRFTARRRLAAQQQAARTALATLPAVERTVLESAYFRRMPLGEIAAALALPVGTIPAHLRAGLDRLRTALTGEAARISGAEEAVAPAPAASPVVPAPPVSPLGQLADALAGMEAAQQQAADLRAQTQDVQRRAHLAQQRAAAQQQQATTTLQQLTVLQDLYTYLGTALAARPLPEEPPLAYTTAYFARHPHNIAVSQVVAILADLNAHSDREAYRLLPMLLY